ncbi:MAG: MFS transporter [Pirellulales bacterium]
MATALDEPPSSIRAAAGTGPRRATTLRKDLRAIMGDGASFSVMVGVGETYLPAFALAAGMGELAAGLITTVPLVGGACLQLASPAAVRRLGSHRRWVVLCAVCQCASFVPLVAMILLGRIQPALVFLMAAVYWGAGMGTGPAWNTWVGTLVPGSIRPAYFARRTRVSQAGVLAGFLGGGFALQAGAAWGRVLPAFACLFFTAAVCRFISAAFLASQSEPCPPTSGHRDVPLAEFVRRLRGGADGSLLIYLLCVQSAAQIAGPYFTPYMLNQLHFSYLEYVLLIGTSFVAKIVALPALGRLARRTGARHLLWVGGIGIVPISGLWLVSQSFGFLVIVQLLGGVAWAAYELAMFLLFFETIREEERTSVLTTYNFAHAMATVLGSLLGGMLLALLGERPAAYLTLFALSSAARMGAVMFLGRVPEVSGQVVPIATRMVELRPSIGSIDKPILASLPKQSPDPLSASPGPLEWQAAAAPVEQAVADHV